MIRIKLVPNYLRILVEIKKRGGRIRPYELAKSVGISTSVLYENLMKLMALGFIEKTEEGYAITPKGEEFLKIAKNELQKVVEVI
jgi:Predicted transcriptional regulator